MKAMPKFIESDAYTFFDAMRMGFKDLDVTRHFVKSMKEWDKTLLNAREKDSELE